MFLTAHPQRSEAERNALVVEHQGLVPWALYEVRPRLYHLARQIGWDDAQQEGIVALFRVAEMWDPSMGALSSYAKPSIRRQIVKAAFLWRRDPSHEPEVPVSALADTCVPFADEPDPEDVAMEAETESILHGIMTQIPQRHREILRRRYWGEQSLRLVGEGFGLTRARIGILEQKALAFLRVPVRVGPLARSLDLEQCVVCTGGWEIGCRVCAACREAIGGVIEWLGECHVARVRSKGYPQGNVG